MKRKTIFIIIALIILGIAVSYGTLYYFQYREQELKRMEEERQKAGQEKVTEEEAELNRLREEAKQRLDMETGELPIAEQSKQLESLRLEAEKRLEYKKSAIQAQPETQELTLDQRREEAKKRLLNQ